VTGVPQQRDTCAEHEQEREHGNDGSLRGHQPAHSLLRGGTLGDFALSNAAVPVNIPGTRVLGT
jgi:hypothetical protein